MHIWKSLKRYDKWTEKKHRLRDAFPQNSLFFQFPFLMASNSCEDDEAIEYIVESLAAKNALDPEQAVKLAALVDDYLDAQQMFLESQGMVEYD